MSGKRIVTLCILTALISACSAKGTAKGGGKVGPEDFRNKVAGPDISGHWISGCESDRWNDGYVRFDVTINGQDITRSFTTYTDAVCTKEVETTAWKGWYRFSEAFSNGVYEVEYKFIMGNSGGHFYTGDNVMLKDGQLWISDRYIGETVVPHIAMNRVDGPQPAVGPFLGQWTSACSEDPLNAGMGKREVLMVLGEDITRDRITYGDYPDCNRPVDRQTSHSKAQVKDSSHVQIEGVIYEAATEAGKSVLKTATLSFERTAKPENADFKPVYSSACADFSGYWQMNNFYFKVVQDGCKRVALTGDDVPFFASTYYDLDFFPDQQKWQRMNSNYLWTQTTFNSQGLTMNYDVRRNDGSIGQRIEKIYLSRTPCDLSNPNQNYLVIEILDRASGRSLSCDFYAPWSK